MKYVIYTRKSKSKRVKNDAGEWIDEPDPLSHAMQISDCLKIVGDNHYLHFQESDVSRDDELDKRPVLMDALSSLSKGDVLLVWKSCRLVANQMVLAQIMEMVRKKKATIYSYNEPNLYEESPAGKAFLQMMTTFNEFQVNTIRHNVKRALQAKKERGECVGHVPYGFRREGKKLVPDEIEQHTVILIHKLYREDGLTLQEVADYLNNEDIRNRGELRWTNQSVRNRLKNRLNYEEIYFPRESQAPLSA